jgi:hypothetical protein
MSASDWISAAPLEAYDETEVPGQVVVDLLAALGLTPKHVNAVRIEPNVIEIDVWVLDADGGPAVVDDRPLVNTIRRRIAWAPVAIAPEGEKRCERICRATDECWEKCALPVGHHGHDDPEPSHRCEVHR